MSSAHAQVRAKITGRWQDVVLRVGIMRWKIFECMSVGKHKAGSQAELCQASPTESLISSVNCISGRCRYTHVYGAGFG